MTFHNIFQYFNVNLHILTYFEAQDFTNPLVKIIFSGRRVVNMSQMIKNNILYGTGASGGPQGTHFAPPATITENLKLSSISLLRGTISPYSGFSITKVILKKNG